MKHHTSKLLICLSEISSATIKTEQLKREANRKKIESDTLFSSANYEEEFLKKIEEQVKTIHLSEILKAYLKRSDVFVRSFKVKEYPRHFGRIDKHLTVHYGPGDETQSINIPDEVFHWSDEQWNSHKYGKENVDPLFLRREKLKEIRFELEAKIANLTTQINHIDAKLNVQS